MSTPNQTPIQAADDEQHAARTQTVETAGTPDGDDLQTEFTITVRRVQVKVQARGVLAE